MFVRLVQVKAVEISDDLLTYTLSDGRCLLAPLTWFPRLTHGTPRGGCTWRLIGQGSGVHWPDLDEDISARNLLEGNASGESQESLRKLLESRGGG